MTIEKIFVSVNKLYRRTGLRKTLFVTLTILFSQSKNKYNIIHEYEDRNRDISLK